MNTIEIAKILRKLSSKRFLGVYPCDKLPQKLPKKRPLILVANTDEHNKQGTHWIAIYLNKDYKTAEYFDPLGISPIKKNFINF